LEHGAQDFGDRTGAAGTIHGWIEGEQLPEGLFIGQQLGAEELVASQRQGRDIESELPAKRGLGVVTQALLVADGAEEQIERPGSRLALPEAALADEALIQPAKLSRNFAETLRNEDFFVYHF
jgi:hypothetical protein